MDHTHFLIAHGALSLGLLIMTVLILRLEYRTYNVALLAWLTLAVIYVIPSIFDPYVIGPTVKDETLLNSSLFAFIFTFLYLATRMVTCGSETCGYQGLGWEGIVERLRANSRAPHAVKVMTWLCLLALLLCVMSIVSVSGLSGLLSGTYHTYRMGSNRMMFLLAAFLLSVGSGGLFIAWARGYRVPAAVIAAASFLVYLISKTRQVVIPMVVPVFLFMIYRNKSVKGYLKIGFVIAVAYYGALFLQVVRYQGTFVEGIASISQLGLYRQFAQIASAGGGEASTRFGFYTVMQDGHNIRSLFIFIPKSLVPSLKVDDTDVHIYRLHYGDLESAYPTMHATLFGNSFANLGFYAVAIGVLFALVAHLVNIFLARMPEILRIMIYGETGKAFMMIGRGSVYNAIAGFSYILVLILLTYVILIRERKTARGELAREEQ